MENTYDKLFLCDKFIIITFYIYMGLIPSYIYITDILGIYSFNTLYIPVLVIVIYYFLAILQKRKANFCFDVGLLILILIIGIQLINLPRITADFQNGLYIFMRTAIHTIFISFYMWKNGSLIKVQKKLFEIKKFKFIVIIIYMIYMLVIFYGFLLNLNNTIGFKYMIDLGDKSGMYLFLGDTFAIYSFIIMSIIKKKRYKFYNCIISILILYSISSRMSLIAYVAALFMYAFILFMKTKYKKLAYGAFVVFGVLAIIVYLNLDNIIMFLGEVAPDSRVFSLLYLGKEDASYTSRSYLMQVGLNELKNNWFMGKFLYEVYIFGDTGSYIHNLLSIWAEYGLIPFISFILYLAYNFIKVIGNQLSNKDGFDDIIFILSCFTIISMTFGRSYNFSYIWFVIGAFPKYFNKKMSWKDS